MPTEAYLELQRLLSAFIGSLGTVFSFVKSDMDEKLEIMELQFSTHRTNGRTFRHLLDVVQYEIQQNITTSQTKPKSASRTLLRLHRTLLFISLFLRKFVEQESHEKPSVIAAEAYDKSLSPHHPWLIRKTVSVALVTLPGREDLLVRIYGEGRPRDKEALLATLELIEQVHRVVDEFFSSNNLQALP